MTRHSQRPQRDNTDLDKFFAEADDIIENWHPGYDANEWHADGSHQAREIGGDYYLDDRPIGRPDDEAADYVAARRREHPRNGGGLFRPRQEVTAPEHLPRHGGRVQEPHLHLPNPARPVDDVMHYPPSYVPTVMQIWLTDVWFAGWLGVIRQVDADNIRNAFPSLQHLVDFQRLLTYHHILDHEDLVGRIDRQWTSVMNAVERHADNVRSVILPSGNVYTPGNPVPWPEWEECLLPVPPDRGEEYVRQVYLHSWLMLRPQLPIPVPVVGAIEGLVRQIVETQFSGMRLVAGLHGSRFAYHRDEEVFGTRFTLRTPAMGPNGLVWLTADAMVADELAHRAHRITRYDLPFMTSDDAALRDAASRAGIHPDWLVQGSWTTEVPPSAGMHDTSGRESFEYELLSPTSDELREAIEELRTTEHD